jgi:hypothetical protein
MEKIGEINLSTATSPLAASLVVADDQDNLEIKIEEKKIKTCGLWLNEGVTRANLMGYFLLSFLTAFVVTFQITYLPQLLHQKLNMDE